MKLLRRHAEDTILRRLGSFRVVVLSGARQVGKSTLAHMVLDRVGGTYLTLDQPDVLEQALLDPDGLIRGTEGLVVIDEVQRAPDILRAVKLVVDEDPRPGRFLLTGSANLLQMRDVTETLAGRAAWVGLGPLTWSEIVGAPCPGSVDAAFHATDARRFVAGFAPANTSSAIDARQRALQGGMPGVIAFDAEQRWAWYDSYRTTFLERDLRQLSNVGNIAEFNRLMNLAFLRSGGLLNKAGLASDAQVSYTTADRYLDLLGTAFQVRLLQPYLPNVTKRLKKSPKLYAVDTGAAARAANARDWEDAVAIGRDGALLETFAVGDLIACDALSAGGSAHFFWRTDAGAEVDLVIERGTRVVGIEIKATTSVRHNDFSGLRALRETIGDRFALGIVAHLGTGARAVDESLCSVPLASLLGATQPSS